MIPNICECGHRTEEHVAGHKECTIPGCACGAFHWVDLSKAKNRVCTVCGREYQCSHNSTAEKSICNICTKHTEDNYQSDLINYLFGYRDTVVSKLLAKRLAMEIHSHGLSIQNLWDHWIKQTE